jgi:23S rRNA pseudouridine1911/1915/1917 synthase
VTGAGRRLDVALIARHPELSRRKAQEAIEKGHVLVDGAVVREAGTRVVESADIVLDRNRKALPRTRLSLPLLYADDALVIVDKPAGLLSVSTAPDAKGEDTALARVLDYARHRDPHRGYARAVHRLDRDTSGALAVALSPAAWRGLRALFAEHRIERRYAALVVGAPPSDQGVVDLPIHDTYEGGRRRVARPGEPQRPALTRYAVAERFQGASLLDVTLETGRQHQIRVHLAHIRLPVLGDRVYGEPDRTPPARVARQMLHARSLAFTHPLTEAPVRAESPLPADFETVLAALRRGPRDPRRR